MPQKTSLKTTGGVPDDELQDLEKKAFANILDFARVDSRGRLEVFDFEKAAELGATVSMRTRISGRGKNAREVRTLTISMPDKVRALTRLGDSMGLFPKPRRRVRKPRGR